MEAWWKTMGEPCAPVVRALNVARDRLDVAAKSLEQAKTPEAADRAKADKSAAEAKVVEATQLKTQAAATEQAKTQEALAAATAAWDAEKASDVANRTLREGDRAIEPISMLISKKTGRIHIRQAWRTLHEAPVTFKDPDTPLGTHVYVAVDTQDDGKANADLARPRLLMLGKAIGQNCDEDQIVDAEHDLHDDQRQQRHPRRRVVDPGKERRQEFKDLHGF